MHESDPLIRQVRRNTIAKCELQVLLALWKTISKRPKSIHCEAIFNDSVFQEVRELIRRKEDCRKFFCVTPVNYAYICGQFEQIEYSQLEDKLKRRYLWLRKMGIDLQLHVHISMLRSRNSYSLQKDMVTWGKEWLENQGYSPKELVMGWFLSNSDTERIARELGLRVVRREDYFYLHDYDLSSYVNGEIDWQ